MQRLEIVETGRRRRFSAAAKCRIVEESYAGARLASATARRHGISVPLLFSWRRAYAQGRLGEATAAGDGAEAVRFMPALVVDDGATSPRVAARAGEAQLELVTGGGDRIVLGADFAAAALVRLLDVLERRR